MFHLHDKILTLVFIFVSIVNLIVSSSSEYSSLSKDTNHSTHARPPLRSAPAPDAAPVTSTRSHSPPAQDAADEITPRVSSASSASSALATRNIPIPRLPNRNRQPRQPRSRPTLGIRNRQAIAIEQRHRRQEQRNRRNTTFNCAPCNIKCNSRLPSEITCADASTSTLVLPNRVSRSARTATVSSRVIAITNVTLGVSITLG